MCNLHDGASKRVIHSRRCFLGSQQSTLSPLPSEPPGSHLPHTADVAKPQPSPTTSNLLAHKTTHIVVAEFLMQPHSINIFDPLIILILLFSGPSPQFLLRDGTIYGIYRDKEQHRGAMRQQANVALNKE